MPLTALCAICHVNAIKYTCPRCSIHTCSLPCVKRHKQYAQCSGVRNPAAYRKRAELATPTSIDQDFNFITKVERTLQRAEDDVADRGIHLAPAGLNRLGGPARTKFEMELQARDIKLIRAPEGLSRRKQNRSAWKGNNISWTIEWLAHTWRKPGYRILLSRGRSSRASLHVSGRSGCRRRESGMKILPPSRRRPSLTTQRRRKPTTMATRSSQRRRQTWSRMTTKNAARMKQVSPELHFYLHRPQTSSKLKCLVPIDSNSTWKEVLKGRTLLEHPTVYVREEPPHELQKPFMLEGDYLEAHGEDVVVPTCTTA